MSCLFKPRDYFEVSQTNLRVNASQHHVDHSLRLPGTYKSYSARVDPEIPRACRPNRMQLARLGLLLAILLIPDPLPHYLPVLHLYRLTSFPLLRLVVARQATP
jgi:hypothetical protein